MHQTIVLRFTCNITVRSFPSLNLSPYFMSHFLLLKISNWQCKRPKISIKILIGEPKVSFSIRYNHYSPFAWILWSQVSDVNSPVLGGFGFFFFALLVLLHQMFFFSFFFVLINMAHPCFIQTWKKNNSESVNVHEGINVGFHAGVALLMCFSFVILISLIIVKSPISPRWSLSISIIYLILWKYKILDYALADPGGGSGGSNPSPLEK